jgi:3-carboxy-cis,cis-muconate cycloisomerase
MEGLEVNEGRMRENLDAGGGLLMSEALLAALSRKVGRREAQRLAREAGERTRREGRTLLEVASEEQGIRGQLSAEELERAFDPTLYLGSADLFIDRALDGYREVAEAGGA